MPTGTKDLMRTPTNTQSHKATKRLTKVYAISEYSDEYPDQALLPYDVFLRKADAQRTFDRVNKPILNYITGEKTNSHCVVEYEVK